MMFPYSFSIWSFTLRLATTELFGTFLVYESCLTYHNISLRGHSPLTTYSVLTITKLSSLNIPVPLTIGLQSTVAGYNLVLNLSTALLPTSNAASTGAQVKTSEESILVHRIGVRTRWLTIRGLRDSRCVSP